MCQFVNFESKENLQSLYDTMYIRVTKLFLLSMQWTLCSSKNHMRAAMYASNMIYHWGGGRRGGKPEQACIADLMFCHGTQIMDNSRICHCLLFHEHGKQNFVQPFRLSRKLLRYTHAWTKLHNEVVS